MSMQQALGAVGFVVGAYFGYPQLGFVVGSLVGAALTPAQKVEGPRIDDQKVTVSTEGAGIARLWGTARLGGNVIESTDKMEEANTETQGKGGGGVKSTTYKYFVDMRTLLCEAREGATYAIRKIWQDGKLVYDAGTGASVGSALASAENQAAALILYQGEEDQLPDPTEEARYGIGNVPAYRGVVSVVINHVECPGGRVPQFSFELCVGGTTEVVSSELFTAPGGTNAYGAAVTSEGAWHVVGVPSTGEEASIDVYYGTWQGSSLIRRIGLPYNAPGNYTLVRSIQGQPAGLYFVDDTAYTTVYRINYESGPPSSIATLEGVISDYSSDTGGVAQDPITGKYAWVRINTFIPDAVLFISDGSSREADTIPGDFSPIAFYANVIYSLYKDGDQLKIAQRSGDDGSVVAADIDGPVLPSSSIPFSALQVNENGVFAVISDSAQSRFYKIDISGWTLLAVSDVSMQNFYSHTSPTFWTNGEVAIIPNPGLGIYTFVQFAAVTPVLVEVADIIADQCAGAGLQPSQFDVSTIDESVWGYTLTNPASARAGIQPMMTAFAIDATDEDEQIRFFHRADKTSLATVAYDELGCVEDGSEPGDPMPLTRANVTELARSVTVSYINREFDYQTSTEEARRQVSEATADQNVEIAISMDSDQAATAAHRILYDAHNERNRRSMKLSRKYACYSAGDVLTVEYPRGTLSDWRLVQVTDTGALIEAEAVPADAELYTQTAIGGTGYAGQEVVPLAAPLRQVILDIPILRDQDNNAGIYDAIDSFASVRAEGELFVGDDDASLESRGTVSASAPIGLAETVPAAWSVNLIDDLNIFTVNIGDDEISSITRDQLLGGTENVWALGALGRWEIGKSRTSNSLGAGRYTLSSHLRGLFGTEQYTGTHVAGDTFVLLRPVGMLRPNMSVGELGQEKKYRVVAKGRSLDSASSQSYANTGEGLRPLSPVNLRRAVDSRDLHVDRRSRLSMNNLTGALPLGESSEAYQWEFFASGSYDVVIGTAETTTSTITAAQQTAISVDPDVTAYVRVRQISDSVGPGHELQASA